MPKTNPNWRPTSNTKAMPPWLSDELPEVSDVAESVRKLEAEVEVAQRQAYEADKALEAAPNVDRRAAANAEGRLPAATEPKARQAVADAQRRLQALQDKRRTAWREQDQLLAQHVDKVQAAHGRKREASLSAMADAVAAIEAGIEQFEFDERVAAAIEQASEVGWQLSSPGPGYLERQRARAEEKLRGDLEFRSHQIGSAYELAASLRWRLGLVEVEEESEEVAA